ncbi:MAG: hypothetical protein ABIP71_05330, partial [Verrucomicrobiota bacterium]
AEVNKLIREYFAAAGVDFGVPPAVTNAFDWFTGNAFFATHTNPASGILTSQLPLPDFSVRSGSGVEQNGKALFFNVLTGTLMVRALLQDLEIIQTAIEVLSSQPPQITVEAKFVEIGEETMKKLGADWFKRNAIYLATNQTASGVILTGTNVTKDKIGAAGNSINSLPAVTGIFTEAQYQVVLKALEEFAGTDVLSAPKVTTLSGRQTQISVLDLHTVVNGPGLDPVTDANVFSTNGFRLEAIPFGSVLDVVPWVSSDGFAIEMTVIATVTEFLGNGKNASKPSPRIRSRQFIESAKIWDGQTFMLGQIEQNELAGEKKHLLVFVTAKIIDATGNRVHKEELPFTTNSIPKQPERK